MKPITVIESKPILRKPFPKDPYLEISELFYNTIQGEGVYAGTPAVFLRLQHCTMNCAWCDSASVWRQGNPYSINELIDIFIKNGVVDALSRGQHLILTGGSPLAQQEALSMFLVALIKRTGVFPFIEIENECTLRPEPSIISLIHCWNNSPKLSNSGNSRIVRYQPPILRYLSELSNAWFKFVVRNESDWAEIQENYITPGYIKKEQIILMPVGGSRQELESNRENVVSLAIEHGVRYSDRLHVEIWDQLTGV